MHHHHPRITRSIGLVLLIAGAIVPLTAASDEDHRGSATTKPALTLTIRCDQTAMKAGDEVAITFVIKNQGDSPYEYPDRNYDRSGRMDEYQLTAIDTDAAPVADPRARRQASIGGGIVTQRSLAPGQSFSKTIALNRWALVTKAGAYRVTGTYFSQGQGIVSAPIEIVLQPRTDAEMGQYINGLSAKLKVSLESKKDLANGLQKRDELVQKLAFTCDSRIMPALIDAMYETKGEDTVFWAEEAFNYYLAKDDRINSALVNAATERGMAPGMFWSLKIRGVPHAQIKKLIAVSLSADHPKAWPEGALAAQQYGDDSFTTRLIVIATDKQSTGRDQAIYALSLNRTDESVAALKQLLKDQEVPPFRGQSIGQLTSEAIRIAYLSRGNSEGRQLRPDDFGPEYQRSQ